MGVPFLTREMCQRHRWLRRTVIVFAIITLTILAPVALWQGLWPWLKRLPRDFWNEVLYPLYDQYRDAAAAFVREWR